MRRKKKVDWDLVVGLFCVIFGFGCCFINKPAEASSEIRYLPATSTACYISTDWDNRFDPDPGIPEAQIPDMILNDDDILLIAKLCTAEAGNQSEYGKRLVIDVVLNRMKHKKFPRTAEGVIFAKGQFSTKSVLDQYTPTEEMKKLVIEEAAFRTNTKVMFFNSGDGYANGKPMFKEGAHYFASYD